MADISDISNWTAIKARNQSQQRPLDNEWALVPKRWGHSLHPMTSYMGMFPARLARYMIRQFSDPGDVVLDCYSGRGTAPLQACLDGRVGIGVDLNPLGYLLTHAKVDPPSCHEAFARLADLEQHFAPGDPTSIDPNIAMIFHPTTLEQLVYLRDQLNSTNKVDRFLLAALTGIAHGDYRKNGTESAYLSISMPNTFSMSPNYVKQYIASRELQALPTDTFAALRQKLDRLFIDPLPSTRGRAYKWNTRDLSSLDDPDLQSARVRLVCTSPPYLQVMQYGRYNWIRLWLLKEDSREVDRLLDDQHTLPSYLGLMAATIDQVERVISEDGTVALVIGDVQEFDWTRTENGSAKSVREHHQLADRVWEHLATRTDLRRVATIEDRLPINDKVSRIWGGNKGHATLIDRVLVLNRTGKEPTYRRVYWGLPFQYGLVSTAQGDDRASLPDGPILMPSQRTALKEALDAYLVAPDGWNHEREHPPFATTWGQLCIDPSSIAQGEGEPILQVLLGFSLLPTDRTVNPGRAALARAIRTITEWRDQQSLSSARAGCEMNRLAGLLPSGGNGLPIVIANICAERSSPAGRSRLLEATLGEASPLNRRGVVRALAWLTSAGLSISRPPWSHEVDWTMFVPTDRWTRTGLEELGLDKRLVRNDEAIRDWFTLAAEDIDLTSLGLPASFDPPLLQRAFSWNVGRRIDQPSALPQAAQ